MAFVVHIKRSPIPWPATQRPRVTFWLHRGPHTALLMNYVPQPASLGEAFHTLVQPQGNGLVSRWACFNLIAYMLHYHPGMEETLFEADVDAGTWFGTLANLHHSTLELLNREAFRDARATTHPISRAWDDELMFPYGPPGGTLDKFRRGELLDHFLREPYIIAKSFIEGGLSTTKLWTECQRVNHRPGDRLDQKLPDFLRRVYADVQPIQFVLMPHMPPFENDRALVQIEL